jgi:hypothetical protein
MSDLISEAKGKVLSALDDVVDAVETDTRAESVAELDARAGVIAAQSAQIGLLTDERNIAQSAANTSEARLAEANTRIVELEDRLADALNAAEAGRRAVEDLTAQLADAKAEIERLEALVPQPEPTVTLIGSNLANPIPTDADLQVTRVYFDPGSFTSTTQPTFQNKASCRDAYAMGCRVFVVSVKDYTPAAQTRIGAFLDTVPADAEILFSFFHEHEGNIDDGDFTYAQYVERFDQACAPARARGIKTGPIHNGMSMVAGKWVWGNYREPDLSKCQFWGTDCYDKNAKGVGIYSEWLTYAKTTGLPIVVGEHGQPQGPTQTTYAKDARELFIREGVFAACWWHQQFTGNPNYVMTPATQAAWFGLPA